MMRRFVPTIFVLALLATACGGGTSVVGGGASFCDLASDRAEQEARFETIDFTDPEAIESAFKESRDLIKRATDIAPDAVKADMELIRDDFLVAFDAIEAADFDLFSAEQPEELPGADAAGDRVDAYIESECGVDLTESEGPSEEEIVDQLDESGRGDDLVTTALIEAGVAPDEAACLAEAISIDEFLALSQGETPAEILDRFGECGVSLADLAEFGGAEPDDLVVDDIPADLPDGALEIFVAQFVEAGFSEDEAACIADSMFGGDPETQGDPLAAFETCDISLARLAELGDIGG